MNKNKIYKNGYAILALSENLKYQEATDIAIIFKKFLKKWKPVVKMLMEDIEPTKASKNSCAFISGLFEKCAIRPIATGVLQKVHWGMLEDDWYPREEFDKYFDDLEEDLVPALKIELKEINRLEAMDESKIVEWIKTGYYKEKINGKICSVRDERFINKNIIEQLWKKDLDQKFIESKITYKKDEDFMNFTKEYNKGAGEVFLICQNLFEIFDNKSAFIKIGYVINNFDGIKNKENNVNSYKKFLKLWRKFIISIINNIDMIFYDIEYLNVFIGIFQKYGIRQVAAGMMQEYVWNIEHPDWFDKERSKKINKNYMKNMIDALHIEVYETAWMENINDKQLESWILTANYIN